MSKRVSIKPIDKPQSSAQKSVKITGYGKRMRIREVKPKLSYKDRVARYNYYTQSASQVSLGVKLGFKVILVAIALYFISTLWSSDFSFVHFMNVVTRPDYAPFDFVSLITNLNAWVNNLPSWLEWAGTGIRVIAMLGLGTAYMLGFVLMLLGGIFVFA